MGKGKLAKFADMAGYPHVFEYPYSVVDEAPLDKSLTPGRPGASSVCSRLPAIFGMKGRWHEDFFRNDHPIVLELGCGRGEYTVGMARLCPGRNFIGVDIKGARMWTGATEALREGLPNVAFLRTNIEIVDRFFAADEVAEIWLTFSDPQMKKVTKRLTSTFFMTRYRRFLRDRGRIHLKTDSNFLFTYTEYMVEKNGLPIEFSTRDLYHDTSAVRLDTEEARILNIRTYYEQQWLDRGLNIKYMRFLLPQAGTLAEPEAEIELDEYRSYNRSRRSTLGTAR